ncbi:MAG: hypothetical protein NT159_00540 [Proteobacteria bacterium]|nr:hypothetical protein [Pseudomonadota bacterium]
MITETIAYLETNKAALGLALVGGAAEFQKAAETNPPATPAAYVIELSEDAGPNLVPPDVHQRVKANIGIVHVIRNVADAKGDAARKDMEALRGGTKGKLLGWSPATGYAAYERARSNLLVFRDAHMWWQDGYSTEFFDRSVL